MSLGKLRDRVLSSWVSSSAVDEDDQPVEQQLHSLLLQLPVTDPTKLLDCLTQAHRCFNYLRNSISDSAEANDAAVVLLIELTSCVSRCAMRVIESHLTIVPSHASYWRRRHRVPWLERWFQQASVFLTRIRQHRSLSFLRKQSSVSTSIPAIKARRQSWTMDRMVLETRQKAEREQRASSLDAWMDEHCYRLAQLHCICARLDAISTSPNNPWRCHSSSSSSNSFDEEDVADFITMNQAFSILPQTIRTLHLLISPESSPPSLLSAAISIDNALTGFEQLMSCVHSLQSLSDQMSQFNAEHQPPSHWKRHWPSYVLGGLLLCGAGCLAYRQRDVMRHLWHEFQLSLHRFWHEHVTEPLGEISMEFLGDFIRRQEEKIVTPEEVAMNRASLSQMILEYVTEHVDDISAVSKLSVDDIKSTLPARAAAQDVSLVMQHFETLVKSPLLKGPTVAQAVLLQLQDVKTAAFGAMLKVEDLLASNRSVSRENFVFLSRSPRSHQFDFLFFTDTSLNLSVAAFLPACGIVYGMLSTVWWCRGLVVKQKNRSLMHMKLKNRLHELSKFVMIHDRELCRLTEQIGFDSSDPLQQQQMMTRRQGERLGHYLMRVRRVRDIAAVLKEPWLQSDLAALSCTDLRADQCKSIIDQLYRRYHFLTK